MAKRVLDVGNCNMDHGSLTRLLTREFDVEIVRAHKIDDALAAMEKGAFDLVLVNRQMDRGGAPGLAIIEEIKRRPETSATPVMMITNFAEHQQTAVASGAEPGFGKSELDSPSTRERLAKFLA